MDSYEPMPNGKHTAYQYPPQRSRYNWTNIASFLWLVFSVYPVYMFFTQRSPTPLMPSETPRRDTTVTRTVVMPSIGATPLPGHIDLDKPEYAHRLTDAIDIFEDFHTNENCRFSSLDLHGPFEPLCEDKESLLRAMAWGGRLGVDAPFSPRDCDMRWFSTSEICAILSRFSRINIVGDSMMRNLAIAMHIFTRADLVNGGRADWREDPEGHDCSCQGVFDDRSCTLHAIASTSLARDASPGSIVCSTVSADIEYHHLLEHPIKQEDLDEFTSYQPRTKPARPVAFIMGHGLWNDLDQIKTIAWMEQLTTAITKRSPWVSDAGELFPRLFLTPNAAGEKKPDLFIARQGNIALTRFEKAIGHWVRKQGMDHLGTYNMSIQATNSDGTHGGMKINLIKAMMVFNWLNAVDVTQFSGAVIEMQRGQQFGSQQFGSPPLHG